MSNLLHKVKDAVTHDKPSHSSNTAQYDPNISNQADPRVDNTFKGTAGTTGTTGVGGAGAGGVSSTVPHQNTTTHGRPSEYDNTRSTNAGPHTSNIANKVDPRVDNSFKGTAGTAGTTGTTGIGGAGAGGVSSAAPYQNTTNTHSTNAGPHTSNIANKVDPRVDNSFKRTTGTTGTTGIGGAGAGGVSSTVPHQNTTTHGRPSEYDNTRSTNAGPHTSNIANQADPRVDTTLGQSGTTGVASGGYSNPHSANTGLHGSNVANTTDPRVDSNRNNYGTTGGISGGYDNPHSTNAGPHGSNVANVVDPRVDSDRSKVGTAGGVTSSGIAPGNTASGGITSGGHNVGNPQLANAEPNSASRADPRFGTSDRNLRSGVAPAGSSYTSPGSGTTQNTAGPHNSDLLNKLDPRVDSNLDNSRTIGRDATRS